MTSFRINQEGNMIKVKNQCLYAHMEKFFVVITMFLIILATFKYVSHGETYIYEVRGGADDKIELNNNIVSQDIVIDENAEWSKYSYAVYLYTEEEVNEGVIEVALLQWGGVIDSTEIRPINIKKGWCEFRELDYSKLSAGYATIQLSGQDLDKPVYVGIKKNVYNIPNCSINGETTENTIEQRYHYNYNNFEYKLRCAVFILFIIISIVGTYLACAKEDSRKTSNYICVVLVFSYMCLTFIYDSSVWMSPTWSEAVTNFLYYGQTETLWNNIVQTDAGYWPLFQRLLALIIIRGFGLPAYYALFVMQVVAYFVSGLILSFFSKYQFREYFSLKYRYQLSLLFMILIIRKDTGAFINFIVYGFLIIMFYFLVDSKEWTKGEFITICVFSCLACMSKGTYVTVLPFMIVCAILFHKNYTKRDYIFSVICATGAGIQLIYYLAYGRQLYYLRSGINWIDKKGSAGSEQYYIKLILQSLIDVLQDILMVFGDEIEIFNGISIVIFVCAWLFIVNLFIKEIIIKYVLKEKIDRNIQISFMAFIFIFAQSLFLRITIFGTTENDVFSDAFWTFSQVDIGSRYYIPIFIAVFVLLIVIAKMLQEKNINKIQIVFMVIVILCFMIGQPRLQLKGYGNDEYVAERTAFADLPAEYNLFKNSESVLYRLIPIQVGTASWTYAWKYSKNALAYCLGEDIYSWPATVTCTDFELEDVWTGSVIFGDYPINTDCEIWQIFITKLNLVERSNYKIVLFDKDGNIIHQQYQDNTNYQKLTSFTFDTGISGVNQIAILGADDNRVYIENSMYIVTEEGQQYFME